MDFLESVAQYYLARKSEADWTDLCFVFPSHRAGVFFKNALRRQIGNRIIFGLRIVTIDELIGSNETLQQADKLTLCFELYKTYCDVFANVESAVLDFDVFYSWAPMFLGDFDDVDKYLVDARQIFSNLNELEKISDDLSYLSENQRRAIQQFWNVTFMSKDDGSDEQYRLRFIATYEHMYELYETFRNRLRLKGLAYAGMLYRDVAENRASTNFLLDGSMRYAFVGFNALTTSEQQIFKRLRDTGVADFFWDYTEAMLRPIFENDDHGAGRFMRQFVKEFQAPRDYELPKNQSVPEFVITNYAYPQGQVAKVSQFLQNNYSDDSAERTAIVLTDENMLIPVISALPDNVHKVNVTMGYPLKFTQMFGLAELLQRLHRQRNQQIVNGETTYYHRDVLAVLRHSVVASIVGDKTGELVRKIVGDNMIRVPQHELTADDDLLSKIFKSIEVKGVAKYLLDIFETIYNRYIDDNEMLRECAYSMVKTINRFGDLVSASDVDIADTDLEFVMFISMAKMQTVDFCGLPLAGLQVMGILETRAVDFDNLVILDLNEGVFPKSGTANTFIPYVLRKSFGLPTHEFQDSIFSYYFFRLINRAKHVELLYTSYVEGERKGISRFLLQLIYEMRIDVTRKVAVHNLCLSQNTNPPITKTPEIMARLRRRCTSDGYLSPSSLSTYIECPKRFCLTRVLGIYEADEVTEEAGNQHIGTIFHYVMENLYRPGMVFTEDERKLLGNTAHIKQLICKGFETFLKINNCTEESLVGRNILYFNLILEYVRNVLAGEQIGMTFVAAESNLRLDFKAGDNLTLCIGGKIDRQHRLSDGRRLYVADYKTGSTKGKRDCFASADELFDPGKHDKVKHIFQTMFYCMLLKMSGVAEPLYPSVIWTRSKKASPEILYNKEIVSFDQVRDDFEAALRRLLAELFDENIPFTPTENAKSCDYCPVAVICGKHPNN